MLSPSNIFSLKFTSNNLPKTGFERAAETGISPRVILISLNVKPICLACSVKNGNSPIKPTKQIKSMITYINSNSRVCKYVNVQNMVFFVF